MNPFEVIPQLTDNCEIEFKKYKNPQLRTFYQTVLDEGRKEDSINKVITNPLRIPDKPKEDVRDLLCDDIMKNEDELLAESIKEMKRIRLVEEKTRQRIRENSVELRELEQKIQCAYSYKALEAQKYERALETTKEKALRLQEDEVLSKARITYAEQERLLEYQERQKKLALREDLKDQMQNNTQKRARQLQEFIEEKKTLDDILQKSYNEQLKEMQLKVDKKIRLKSEMKECLELIELKKSLEVSTADEEKKEAEKLRHEQDERIRIQKERKKMELLKRAEISEIIGKKVIAMANEKKKKHEELEDLLIEERKARDDKIEREKEEAEIKLRLQLQMEANTMKSQHTQKRLEEQLEDRRYREYLDQQLAEKDRLDKIKNDKRREWKVKERMALLDAFEEKKRRRAEEMTGNLKQHEQDLKDEKFNQQLIEEERIKILKEHLPNLLGYLPPGTLRESDLAILKSIQKN